jgi:hypothetical protein
MCATATAFNAASAEEIRFEGTYTLARNGDLSVSAKMTMPMLIYQKLRENISNLYLVLREFSSARAQTEVADKKADWDDSNRSMVISMKFLGAGRNLGNRWEVDVPKGTEFINLDKAQRTFYFNENSEAGAMATIRGTSKLIMPPEALQFNYDQSRRVVTYTLPPIEAPSGRNLALGVSAAVLFLIGAVLTGASFFISSQKNARV